MLKKILITLVVVAMAAVLAASLFARRAPELLRAALERALGKQVVIGSIEYRFPGTFTLEGFELKEHAPFTGETSFSVDRLRLDVSPISLSRKKLIIDKIEVENADIILRLYRGRLYHALSNTVKPQAAPEGAVSSEAPASAVPAQLEIHKLEIRDSNFQFNDFDIEATGFVVILDEIEADIRNIRVPFERTKTRYSIKARVLQGRDERPAPLSVEGYTVFATRDSDATFEATALSLPYFRTYYGQVTNALIDSGLLDGKLRAQIRKNHLVLDADLEIIGLSFGRYEDGEELFGLKADEILSFLKDVSGGRLKLQFTAEWDLGERGVRARDVIRRSIEKSIKTNVLGNVGRLLQNVIQKVGEGTAGQGKDRAEGALKKLKDWVRF